MTKPTKLTLVRVESLASGAIADATPKPEAVEALEQFLDGDKPMSFMRTCNACGHKQKATPPNRNKELSDAYRNAKCKACGSEALDYGSEQHEDNPDYDYTKD